MTTRKTVRPASILLALALTLTTPGCDWLDPSGTSSRVSPVVSALSVLPPSVFCGPGARVAISFNFSDPQDDIRQMLLVFQHATLDERLDRVVGWDDPKLIHDAATTGRAAYAEFYFECGGPSAGDWSVTVRLEDDRGHLSNELSGDITLVSAR